MAITDINNPFIPKPIDTGTPPAASNEVITPDVAPIDFSADGGKAVTKPVTSPAIPLVNNKEEQGKGLAVETTAKPTLDRQTMKWFGMSQEQWNKLTPEEKQEKSQKALKGIVDAYNKNQEKLGTNKRLSYAEQVKLYRDRMAPGSEEQVKRLTSSVKSLHGKDQADAIKVAYQYEDKDNRDTAETTIATDYTSYDKENVVAAAKETENFSTKNQILAASNAPTADVSKHKELVKTFMSRGEAVQLALADNVGKFGVGTDGQITDEGRAIQLDCFKTINGSEYQSVIESSASNIYTMDKANQAPALQYVYESGNEGAIKAANSHYSDYDESAQEVIEEAYDSDAYATDLFADTADTDTDSGATATISTDNRDEISKIVNNASTVEKSRILAANSDNIDVIKALLTSNPSSDILSDIFKLLDSGKLSPQDRTNLMEFMSKSDIFKDPARLRTLSPSLQAMYLRTLSPEDLKRINPDDLSGIGKDVYNERLAELKPQGAPAKKFGLLKNA